MNFLVHHITKGFIHKPVTCQRALAGKLRGNNRERVMPATAFGAFVPGVFGTVIKNFHAFRGKGGEFLLHLFQGVHDGNTFLKGLTVTLA
jgi:hypothetical protein